MIPQNRDTPGVIDTPLGGDVVAGVSRRSIKLGSSRRHRSSRVGQHKA